MCSALVISSCTNHQQTTEQDNQTLADSTDENSLPLFIDDDGQIAAAYDNLGVDLETLTNAANDGDRYCQETLANMYAYGVGGVRADRTKAFMYYRELANRGHVEAQAIVGYMMLYGYGPVEDAEAGLEMLSTSANNDCPLAFYVLGNFYHYNTEKTAENQAYARVCYSAAVRLGMVSAQAEIDLMDSNK